MLTFSESQPKIGKSEKAGVYSGILHLAPANLAGFNVCATAVRQNLDCVKFCLNKAGRGGIFAKGQDTNIIQRARIRRTQAFFTDRASFFAELVKDIKKLQNKAFDRDMIAAVRLNGTSDIPWEKIKIPGIDRTIMEFFPDVQFYDYTKDHQRMIDYCAGAMPKNYHLTYSWHEKSDPNICRWILENGGNVAAIFRDKKTVPQDHALVPFSPRFPVHNGDTSDARFLDPAGRIIWLSAKGPARKSASAAIF